MISFEFDNYQEPEMMVAKEREEDSPLAPFNPNKKISKKKVKIIKLIKKQ
jgi:hypothetical protein